MFPTLRGGMLELRRLRLLRELERRGTTRTSPEVEGQPLHRVPAAARCWRRKSVSGSSNPSAVGCDSPRRRDASLTASRRYAAAHPAVDAFRGALGSQLRSPPRRWEENRSGIPTHSRRKSVLYVMWISHGLYGTYSDQPRPCSSATNGQPPSIPQNRIASHGRQTGSGLVWPAVP